MRATLILLATASLLFSCNKAKNCEDYKKDCSNIRCIAFLSYFDFKLVDKTTNEDLVFDSNSRYSASDIKLYFDVNRTFPMSIYIDSVGKKIMTMFAREDMYLEVKGVDVYKLTADFRGVDCCSNRVKTLWIDGLMTCSCCKDVVSLAVK